MDKLTFAHSLSVDFVLKTFEDQLVLLILVFSDSLLCPLLISFLIIFHVEHMCAQVQYCLAVDFSCIVFYVRILVYMIIAVRGSNGLRSR
jgi:hypothetical protein